MSGVPYTFASATSSIPLSQLDANFATPATLGNTTVGLGNTVTTVGNLTVSNVTINGLSGGGANGVVYLNTSNVATANASVLAVDGNGYLLSGYTANRNTTQFQAFGSTGNAGFSATRFSNDTYGPAIILEKSRGTSFSSYTAVQSGDTVGQIRFWGDDGTQGIDIAGIKGIVSGSVSTGVVPGNLAFFTTNTSGTQNQNMTLDSSGNLLVGTTSATYNSQVQVGNTNPAFYINNTLTSSLGSSNILRLAFSGVDINNSPCTFIQAYGATTLRFNVDSRGNVTNSNNSYGSLSDVKLKENIVDATPKLADLLKVQVRNYNLKSDPTVKQLGVVAQELETVFPAMVEETPDTDEKGNSLGTFTKSVKYSVFVPMLVKAIQELSAQVTTLQSQVAALQTKVGA